MTTRDGPETPSGAGRAADRAVPDGTTGQDCLARRKAVQAAKDAALRRRARRPRRGRHQAGMIRIMPPGPPDAA